MRSQVIKEKMKTFASRGKVIKLTVIISMALMLVLITGALSFKSSVYINDNGIVKEFKTNETEVEDILSDVGIELYKGDITTFEKNSDNKIFITVIRAFDVTVIADGETNELRLTEGTVADALEKAEVELGEDDIISAELNEDLYAGIEIKVSRVSYKDREVNEEIPFETEYFETSNLKIGTQEVTVEGQNGVKTYLFRDTYIDGKYMGTETVSEEITAEPVTEVVGIGSSLQVPYAKLSDPEKVKLVNGLPEEYVKVVSGKATAYSARPGSLTASNRYAVVGTVAVNPNVIPYGSELYIVAQDGSRVYGYAIAADTGIGLLDGRVTVDVFMGSYEDSCKWGAVYVDVYVLSVGDNRYIKASER